MDRHVILVLVVLAALAFPRSACASCACCCTGGVPPNPICGALSAADCQDVCSTVFLGDAARCGAGFVGCCSQGDTEDCVGNPCPSTASAPVLTQWGLLVVVASLAGLGAFALRQRVRGR